MMTDRVSFTALELSKLETDKEIYCILRMMNLVEKFFATDKINEETYNAEIKKLLTKYEKFARVTPNYNLDEFIQKYNLSHEEISWAKYLIEKGSEPQGERERVIFMQATATFIEVMEALAFSSEDTQTVGEVRSSLERLQSLLKKAIGKFGPEVATKFAQYNRLLEMYITSRSIHESLTMSEAKEIKLTVESLYFMMSQQK